MTRETNTLREVELNVLAELLKNSNTSDRQIARKLRVSQPTVSRLRNELEKEGYIKGYTIIPDFARLGYSIMAFTFPKLRKLTSKQLENARKTTLEDMKTAPSEIIFFERGLGEHFDAVIISLHRDYGSYLNLLRTMREYPFIQSTENLLIDLRDQVHYRPLTFSTLADNLQKQTRKE